MLLVLIGVLLINSLLSIFKSGYYPTFGKYRLFSVVSDSMEPTIPTGNMIVDRVPTHVNEIDVGTVITFETEINGKTVVLTHRVVAVDTSGDFPLYTTRGDGEAVDDPFRTPYGKVIGIFTGRQCGFFGYFFGFLQSTQGAITLMIIMFIVVLAWVVLYYISRQEQRNALARAALKKSARALSNVNLRYDNIHEITAVMDVLGMVTEEPSSHADLKEVDKRLGDFVDAENIELSQTPETAAILDSLPAPDTPSSLAAALSAGATLRQAEDGQTLVLTTASGGKSILLTPVQTPDGVIFCQQGVRLRSDIAPNIEEVGETSMPGNPEFFVGQPLEKSVEYPELPQASGKFVPEMLSPHSDTGLVNTDAMRLAAPAAPAAPAQTANNRLAASSGVKSSEAPDNAVAIARRSEAADSHARLVYAQYRELAAQIELRQAEQLRSLLNETAPLTPEEKSRVADYRTAHPVEKRRRAPLTPEQRTRRKESAERRKAEHEAFLNALDPADRELYLTEQKLARSRAAAIKQLKRIAADRKILDKID